jgi:DNA-binding protein Fis
MPAPQNVHRKKKQTMKFWQLKSGELAMHESCNKYLSLVLRRRLDAEAQRWFTAIESGFDVVVITSEPILQDAVKEYLENTPKFAANTNLKVMALGCVVHPKLSGLSEPQTRRAESQRQRTLTLCSGKPPAGTAAVPFRLPDLQELLPSPSAMTGQFLECTGLERFMEVFDGQKMALLRKLLEMRGPEHFFDAIVQVAYLSGYRGDDESANDYLTHRMAEAEEVVRESNKRFPSGSGGDLNPVDVCSIFDRFIELDEPHDVLKAALAHYVFNKRNVTQTEASKILKVSRSTLQAHLQLAERLNVAELFG